MPWDGVLEGCPEKRSGRKRLCVSQDVVQTFRTALVQAPGQRRLAAWPLLAPTAPAPCSPPPALASARLKFSCFPNCDLILEGRDHVSSLSGILGGWQNTRLSHKRNG